MQKIHALWQANPITDAITPSLFPFLGSPRREFTDFNAALWYLMALHCRYWVSLPEQRSIRKSLLTVISLVEHTWSSNRATRLTSSSVVSGFCCSRPSAIAEILKTWLNALSSMVATSSSSEHTELALCDGHTSNMLLMCLHHAILKERRPWTRGSRTWIGQNITEWYK